MFIAEILFRDMIIPMTKDVAVRYIFSEFGRDPYQPDGEYYWICRGAGGAFESPWDKDDLHSNLYL